jgi:transcriptional regulator with XRE-family HTH domain
VIIVLVIMNRIKEVLKEKGIKQIWLADKLDKSYNMVNGYVQNRQQPRLEILFEIAKLLNIDPKELIQSDHEPKRKTTTHHKT